MTRVDETLTRTTKPVLAIALCSLLGACLALDENNVHPIASIKVNGMEVTSGQPPLTITGAMGSVTLDGSGSMDPDGEIMHREWWNTGMPAGQRFPMGSTLAAGATLFEPDIGKDLASVQVTISGAEPQIFSLYVIDDANEVSVPATVKFVPGTPPAGP